MAETPRVAEYVLTFQYRPTTNGLATDVVELGHARLAVAPEYRDDTTADPRALRRLAAHLAGEMERKARNSNP